MRIFLVLLLNLMLIACEVQRESIEESVLDFGNSSNKTIHSSLLPTDGENYLPYMRSNVAQQILYAIDPNRSAVYQIPLPLSFTAKLPIYHVEYNTDYVEVEARHVSMTDLVLVSDGSLFRVSFQKDKQLLTHQIGSNTNIVHVCEWKQLSFTSPKLVYAKVLL
ncbi:MAG: hypothetical protein OEX00_10190, partial [Gammaproteobacteria bacterium]|nr:hypothetical protein [Gammaproteobacteria bacterium]